MKKLLCLVMSVLMAVPLMMTAFAVEQKTEAEFEKYNLSAEAEVNGGGTDYDRGRSVMLGKQWEGKPSHCFFVNNGLSVCAMRERVNRYTVSYLNMLTLSAMYGKIFLHRKGCEEANI